MPSTRHNLTNANKKVATRWAETQGRKNSFLVFLYAQEKKKAISLKAIGSLFKTKQVKRKKNNSCWKKSEKSGIGDTAEDSNQTNKNN